MGSVETQPPRLKTPKPDFLGIGAPRSGTTWLHYQLRQHPQIWVPPIKELHYWDVHRPGAADDYPIADIRLRQLRRRYLRDHALTSAGRLRRFLTGGCRDWQSLKEAGWVGRFLLARSDDAYACLFPRGVIAGEVTPAYMILPEPVIQQIVALSPQLKAILLLRNPIDREWSGIQVLSGDTGQLVDRDRMINFITTPNTEVRSNYVAAIDKWQKHLREGHLFIGFYDDLVADPAALLGAILRFLGVEPSAAVAEALHRRVNQSAPAARPEQIDQLLAARHLAQIRQLENRFGGHAAAWRQAAETVLARAPCDVKGACESGP